MKEFAMRKFFFLKPQIATHNSQLPTRKLQNHNYSLLAYTFKLFT